MRAILGATVVLALMLAGCGSTESGNANEPTSRIAATTSVPPSPVGSPAPPAFVTAPAAQAALLKATELAQIVGDTEMRPLIEFTHPWEESTGVEPKSCAPRLLFNQAIGAVKYQAVSGNRVKGARGQIAAQLVTVFVDRAQPGAVLADFILMFGYCPAQQAFSTTARDVTQHWMPTEVASEGMDRSSRIASRAGAGADRLEAPARQCYHAAVARANATIESIVCGDGDSKAMANTVIDRIAEKLPG